MPGGADDFDGVSLETGVGFGSQAYSMLTFKVAPSTIIPAPLATMPSL